MIQGVVIEVLSQFGKSRKMFGSALLQRDLLEGCSGWVDALGMADFPSSDVEVGKGEVAGKKGEGEHKGSESLVILDGAQ